MTLKTMSGFEVNDETLAVDLIKKVGIGGNYLRQKHTLLHMRDYYMQLMWRAETFEQAVNKGGMDSLEAANARIEQILREHKPVPLDADKSKGLSAIVNEFGKS